MGILAGYCALLAALGVILPGRTVPGTVLADGTRLHYKCNGFTLLISVLGLLGGACALRIMQPSALVGIAGELFASALLYVLLISIALYIKGRGSKARGESLRARTSNNLLKDLWMGVQLNPQVFGIDLKFFCLRPGMMGLLLLNLSVAAKQLEDIGRVSLPMALFQTFSAMYVVDYFWFEEYMTSTWDIIAENFGGMLVLGDLVWIPFTFSVQSWWLLSHPRDMSWGEAASIIALFGVGFAIFRGANKQKHDFKKNPKHLIWGKPPEVVGGRLLVSGYWGISRHCNYLGDLIVALGLSLPCGMSSPIPYFYPVYLLILLLWRERRDEAKCRRKYREVWVEYCKRVPWRIFPYIY